MRIQLGQTLNQIVAEAIGGIDYRRVVLRDRIQISERSRRKVLVNGCPKSGTTWMLRLLTSIPGYREAGNFGGDHARYLDLQRGDVVHGHDLYSKALWTILQAAGVKVVFMIRDPKDQAVSRMFHAMRDNSHPFHSTIQRMSLDDAILASIEGANGLRGVAQSIEFSSEWLGSGADIKVVHYERLSANPVSEFRGVLEYLDITISDKLTELIVERNRFQRQTAGRRIWETGRLPGQEDRSSHFRKGIVGDWQNYFTESHIRRFSELTVGQLEKIGYDHVRAS